MSSICYYLQQRLLKKRYMKGLLKLVEESKDKWVLSTYENPGALDLGFAKEYIKMLYECEIIKKHKEYKLYYGLVYDNATEDKSLYLRVCRDPNLPLNILNAPQPFPGSIIDTTKRNDLARYPVMPNLRYLDLRCKWLVEFVGSLRLPREDNNEV